MKATAHQLKQPKPLNQQQMQQQQEYSLNIIYKSRKTIRIPNKRMLTAAHSIGQLYPSSKK
tara:strand:- start:319 stop:501 length:183 start_codon:yes stop_codon:yes gene_type:complete